MAKQMAATTMTIIASIRLKPWLDWQHREAAWYGAWVKWREKPACILHMSDLLNDPVGAEPDSFHSTAMGIGASPLAL